MALIPIDQYKRGDFKASPMKTPKIKPLPMKARPIQSVQRPDIKQSTNYKMAASEAVRYADEAKKANSRIGIAKETGKGIVKSLSEFIPKTAVSLAETPGTLIRGTATQKTYNLPVIGKFQSYQSEAENTAKDIIEGKKPLYSALKPFAELPLNFLPLGNKLAPSSLTGKLLSKEAIQGRIGIPSVPVTSAPVQQVVGETRLSALNPVVQNATNSRQVSALNIPRASSETLGTLKPLPVKGGVKLPPKMSSYSNSIPNGEKVNTSLQETNKYRTVHDGGKEVMVDGKPVDIHKDLDTILHKDENGNWVVTEVTSGRSLSGGGFPTSKHAIEYAKSVVDSQGIDNVKRRISEVSGQSNPLLQEARKYKSAEEFAEKAKFRVLLKDLKPTDGHTPEVMKGKLPAKGYEKQPVRVEVNKDGKLQIQDGNRRYYQALERGDKDIEVVFNDQAPMLNFQGEFDRIKSLYNKAQGGKIPDMSSVPVTQEIPTSDPIQKITEALKLAKPLEKQQAAIYSAERAKRVARMIAAGKTPGEQGYFAQLGALKGELPKVQFESIRKQIAQPDIDHLFNSVEGSKILTPFEKITAKTGLSKLLGAEGGQIPTRGELELLGEVFPPEFMKQVLEKRPLMQKVMEKAGDVLNIPRSLMSSFDLSAPLRQGVFLIGRPKQWGPAFKDMFKYALSEKSYRGLTESIQARPTYQLMRENRLALTDMSKFASKREEVFMSNLAEKIPGIGKMIRASDRAYTGFLNKLRADTFDDLVTKLGKDQAPDIARFVNSATGRGELPEILRNSQALLNGAFFSPRLIASRVNLMNPQYYMSLSAPVRKEALKSLLSFGSTVATVLGLANLAGADVGADPRSADFAKVKVGDTRYDVLGGFQQYAVLAYRLATNEAVSSTTGREFRLDEGYNAPGRLGITMRFLQSKESPVAGFVAGLLSGKDNGGGEFKVGPEIVNRFIPMLTNDLLATISEEGPVKGSLMQAPAVFGVGTNTYTDQIPTLEKTPTGRPTIKWEGYPTVGDKVSNFLSGKEISNIPKEQWAPLYQERLKEQKRKVELDKAKETVLISGQPQYVGDTFIYLDNGIVKTKKITPTDRTPLQKKVLNPFYTK